MGAIKLLQWTDITMNVQVLQVSCSRFLVIHQLVNTFPLPLWTTGLGQGNWPHLGKTMAWAQLGEGTEMDKKKHAVNTIPTYYSLYKQSSQNITSLLPRVI